ncbi:UDP-glucose/GDP-mannose dehydrogenase family protein [Nocardia sp. NBC_01499]|uniref:UDP-glucose dehydrogenase family protein n=1 Tax=Nocardia sp. NBC_01499 TaxID=2903597 RepID=UPI00386F751E
MQGHRIAVIGAGYVGLTTAACMASLGHRVDCADIDERAVRSLRDGRVPIAEPGLEELVAAGLSSGRMRFVVGAAAAIHAETSVVFLCVATPMGPAGVADLSAVESVADELRDLLPPGSIVAIKSTTPPGTARSVSERLARSDVAVVSNPEFLREGTAVRDFLIPDRIVVGADDPDAARSIADLYSAFRAPVVSTDAASAEMIKYASNCFLAVKLSYINSMADLCERVGANIDEVAEGMGLDPRIGSAYLRPGPGWGGPCLPKDSHALVRLAETAGVDVPLVRAALDSNNERRRHIVAKVRDALGGDLIGRRIGLWGMAFKAGTSDLRDSPALAVAELLAEEGADLVAYDPALVPAPGQRIPVAVDAYEAARDSVAVVLLTDCPQFRELDWRRVASAMAEPLIIDTRNYLDPDTLRLSGITIYGLGRSEVEALHS